MSDKTAWKPFSTAPQSPEPIAAWHPGADQSYPVYWYTDPLGRTGHDEWVGVGENEILMTMPTVWRPMYEAPTPEELPGGLQKLLSNKPPIILPASKVAVGHCVIHWADSPDSKHVAVVSRIDSSGKVHARYLSKAVDMKTLHTPEQKGFTPVEAFGVRAYLCDCGLSYWCEEVDDLPVTAAYPQGDLRRWFERQAKPRRLPLRRKAIAPALVALAELTRERKS